MVLLVIPAENIPLFGFSNLLRPLLMSLQVPPNSFTYLSILLLQAFKPHSGDTSLMKPIVNLANKHRQFVSAS